MKEFVDLKSKRILLGVSFGLLSILLFFVTHRSMKFGVAFAFMFLFASALNFRAVLIKKRRGAWIAAWFTLVSLLTLILSQQIQNESIFELPPLQIALGFICCIVPMVLLFSLILHARATGVVISGLLLILATANDYVYGFRGSELCPADLLTIRTAFNVANKYTYTIPGYILLSWLLYFLFLIVAFGLPTIVIERKLLARTGSLFVVLLLSGIFAVLGPRIDVQHFLHSGSYWNGYLLNFTLEIKESIVHKPAGYTPDKVSAISQQYDYDLGKDIGRRPDIIVIMDEAYSDLGVLGDGLKTNIPVSPYIMSLHDNTINGYVLSSVYGGGTPNSEYEFLTGNSLLFVRGMVYQQYIRKPSYSMVSELRSRGYRCIAMHPYLETGWRRNIVWPNLLFDECMFLDAFPQQNLIRGLVSDQEMFEFLLKKYDEHCVNNSNPFFLFGVTMQNHSGYDYEGEEFHYSIRLQGLDKQYKEVEQYLSLVHETDHAVEFLLNELQKRDRDVIVVFYGDHQPAVSESFIKEVHGKALETLDEKQLLQKVPFFIWSNYDSESCNLGVTSLNFLSSYLFEKADMKMPCYNRFLKDIESVIPAMNSRGFYSVPDGKFLQYSEARGRTKEYLDMYWLSEYNSLFDLEHLDKIFFPMDEKTR